MAFFFSELRMPKLENTGAAAVTTSEALIEI
jgi:hypothetical protein